MEVFHRPSPKNLVSIGCRWVIAQCLTRGGMPFGSKSSRRLFQWRPYYLHHLHPDVRARRFM